MGKFQRLLERRQFHEMIELERQLEEFAKWGQVHVVDHVEFENLRYPLYVITLGNTDRRAPTLGFFGGVHGLEKIGSEVILSYMEVILQLLSWDEGFHERLKKSRLVFMPIINPVGMVLRWRSNGNGVDLMRNSPVEADEPRRHALYCGHRISPLLPWYRGKEGEPMEVEAQALCKVVREELFPSEISLAVDIHSGFGARDRLWFPYAHSHKMYPYLSEVTALKALFDRTYPHHFYQIEPVCEQYTIHGDLWDHLVYEFDRSLHRTEKGHHFFPWTLEMGSWAWLRKNPWQILSKLGLYHPIKPHRHNRIMRRHLTLFDFLHRSLLSPGAWLKQSEEQKQAHLEYAIRKWYA